MLNKTYLINRFNEVITSENKTYSENVIGVLSEKTLHKTIKNIFEGNQLYQEVKIDKYYVDICINNKIIEVQTKQFNKLRDKLNYLISINKYDINVVYPVFTNKTIFNINEGIVDKGKKSPKKFKVPELFHELYMIKNLLPNNCLTITILLFEVNEYRIKKNNRKGFECFDRVPTKLVDVITLDKLEDYVNLLPDNLNEMFTSKEICEKTKTNIKYVNKMLNVLKFLNVIELIGKDGKKFVYKKKKVE